MYQLTYRQEPAPVLDLTRLTEDELFIDTMRAIQRAAQGEADGGDEPSYNAAMAHLAESNRRLVAQGHAQRCRIGVYQQAYEAVTALHSGDREPRTLVCNCGADGAPA